MNSMVMNMVIAICGVTPIEDDNNNWSEFERLLKLQQACRAVYYECLDGSVELVKLVECDKEIKHD